MSNPLENLPIIAMRARREQVPAGDVSREVLTRIRQQYWYQPLPLGSLAACSAIAAATVLACSLMHLLALVDPLASFFDLAKSILPWQV